MQIVSTQEQMIAGNRLLPDHLRQNSVLLQFSPPIAKAFAWEFHRIRLTARMLAAGEGDDFKAYLAEPSGNCVRCRAICRRVGVWDHECVNRACPRYRKIQSTRPPRGVIDVLLPSDQIVQVDGVDHCRTLVLVMDQRYRTEVLAAVYRTAGEICDRYGWRLGA